VRFLLSFRQELDDYCKDLASELFASEREGTSNPDDTHLKSLLENWYEVNVSLPLKPIVFELVFSGLCVFLPQVEYVSRAISSLTPFLDSLLYFVLEGRRINVVGDKKISEDVIKFFAASGILQLLPLPAGAESTKAAVPFHYYNSEGTIASPLLLCR